MAREISHYDDVIDSRDVIERIAELTEEREHLVETLTEARDELEAAGEGDDTKALEDAVSVAVDALAGWDADNQAELESLKELADEGEGCEDWEYGATLIRYSYFRDYAMELAEDIGAIKHDAGWPNNCIDWDQAARELQMDYTSVSFNGVTYYVRS